MSRRKQKPAQCPAPDPESLPLAEAKPDPATPMGVPLAPSEENLPSSPSVVAKIPLRNPLQKPDYLNDYIDRKYIPSDPYSQFQDLINSPKSAVDKIREKSAINMARLFLKLTFYPYIEGLSNATGFSDVDELKKLVRGRVTPKSLFVGEDQLRDLDSFIKAPSNVAAIGVLKKSIQHTDDEIRLAMPWWLERIKETRIDFYNVLVTEEDGQWWLQETLVDIAQILKGRI